MSLALMACVPVTRFGCFFSNALKASVICFAKSESLQYCKDDVKDLMIDARMMRWVCHVCDTYLLLK